eukprot:scaffold4455_cov138-Alexandrium_tamarense.AAC.1
MEDGADDGDGINPAETTSQTTLTRISGGDTNCYDSSTRSSSITPNRRLPRRPRDVSWTASAILFIPF